VVSAFVIEQFCGFFSDPIDYDMQLHSIDQPIAGLSGWMSRWILRYIGFWVLAPRSKMKRTIFMY